MDVQTKECLGGWYQTGYAWSEFCLNVIYRRPLMLLEEKHMRLRRPPVDLVLKCMQP